MSMTAPINVAYTSVIPPSSVNCSCWSVYRKQSSSGSSSGPEVGYMLAVCSASTLRFYDLVTTAPQSPPKDPSAYLSSPAGMSKLVLRCCHNLSGNVVAIHPLSPASSTSATLSTEVALLLAFGGGDNKLALVTLDSVSSQIEAKSIVDFYQPLREASKGAASAFATEIIVDVHPSSSCFAAVLGGGYAVAAMNLAEIKPDSTCSLPQSSTSTTSNLPVGFQAVGEPFILDLKKLSDPWTSRSGGAASAVPSLHRRSSTANAAASVSTGFGDIISVKFLHGYNEPTVALLHAPYGRTWCGRTGLRMSPFAVTCLSLSIPQRRAVVLWRCAVLPNDSQYLVSVPAPARGGGGGVLVVAPNSVHHIGTGGFVLGSLAANGYAPASITAGDSLPRGAAGAGAGEAAQQQRRRGHAPLEPNPRPLPKLRLRLDGSKLAFLSPSVAVLSLRGGALYSLELHGAGSGYAGGLSLSALGCRVPSPSVMSAFPLRLPYVDDGKLTSSLSASSSSSSSSSAAAAAAAKAPLHAPKACGFLFVGGSLGDSTLLAYAEKTVALDVPEEPSAKRKRETELLAVSSNKSHTKDEALAMEEAALYEGDGFSDLAAGAAAAPRQTGGERRCIAALSTFDMLVVDTIVQTGPLGFGCEGPTPSRASYEGGKLAREKVYTCGYGQDGGLAILSSPGASSSTEILAEADVEGIKAAYTLPGGKLLLLARKVGEPFLALREIPGSHGATTIGEIGFGDVFDAKSCQLMSTSSLLSSKEVQFGDRVYAIFVLANAKHEVSVLVCAFDGASGRYFHSAAVAVVPPPPENGQPPPLRPPLVSEAKIESNTGRSVAVCAFRFNSGQASIVTLREVRGTLTLDTAHAKGTATDPITAIDLFLQNDALFELNDDDSTSDGLDVGGAATGRQRSGAAPASADGMSMDPEEEELYAETETSAFGIDESKVSAFAMSSVGVLDVDVSNAQIFFACVRKSGSLEIHRCDASTKTLVRVWNSGLNLGYAPNVVTSGDARTPTSRNETSIICDEITFFVAGAKCGMPELRSFYLGVLTSQQDFVLYAARKLSHLNGAVAFSKCNSDIILRGSQATNNHNEKLKKKGAMPVVDAETYCHGRLLRFSDISGHSGLFAAVARPAWVVNERGGAMILPHKARHCAPGALFPVSSFCESFGFAGASGGERGFITIHDRIGRIGTQRLSLFQGLSDVLSGSGYVTQGGMHINKILLGHTVRKIQFIDDPRVSSARHPIYVAIVSVEEDIDMSELDDDGLTDEEREEKRIQDAKMKLEKQVDTDLRGHENDFQKWSDEIQHEDFLEVDNRLGFCPPVPVTKYEVWLLDAGSNWSAIQKYPLDAFEQAITLEVVRLTLDEDETERATRELLQNYEPPFQLMIAVGVGLLDEDGEDSQAKGRILLFEIVEEERESGAMSSDDDRHTLLRFSRANPPAEGDVDGIGPVTAISTLVCNGKQCLLMGAGAEITVHEWKNGELNQIGIYKNAQVPMSIHSFTVFKQYILYADHYDSVFFLVWRDSDKSLNLLAKDFRPCVVFAAGVVSRGGSLAFCVHDDRENLTFFQYAPSDVEKVESKDGRMLVSRADIHIGCTTLDIRSHMCKGSLLSASANVSSTWLALQSQEPSAVNSDEAKKFGLSFGTLEGGYGVVVPVNETTFRRLYWLQNIMANALEQAAACNVFGWRMYKRTTMRGAGQALIKKNVLNGSLLMKFANCPRGVQEDLAAAIGAPVELIMDNLLEINCNNSPI